jgi:hypothetical protein
MVSVGYVLGLIVGGGIAWILFVTVGWQVIDWFGVRWDGWDYIDRHGDYHRRRGE